MFIFQHKGIHKFKAADFLTKNMQPVYICEKSVTVYEPLCGYMAEYTLIGLPDTEDEGTTPLRNISNRLDIPKKLNLISG